MEHSGFTPEELAKENGGVDLARVWRVMTRLPHATSPWLLRCICLGEPGKDFNALIFNHTPSTIALQLADFVEEHRPLAPQYRSPFPWSLEPSVGETAPESGPKNSAA